MNVLKLTLVASSIFALSIGAFAQGKRADNTDRPKKDKIEALKEKLQLDDVQTAKLKEVHADFEAKNKELDTKMDPLKEQLNVLREEKKNNIESMNAEIEKVLTPEQLVKYKEMKAAHQEKRAAKKGEMKQGMKPQNH